jgi:CRISPR/Cas system CSM-associated protein Csm3 (group 7 of RAMP superfamily)
MLAREVIMYQVKLYQIKFSIHSYWRAGTGRSGGALLDEEVHKDAYGLPCLPGRTVKGLLRRAVYRAEKWGLLNGNGGDAKTASLTQYWFGNAENHLENEAGTFSVSDAVLEKELRNYLISLLTSQSTGAKKKGQTLCQGFFHQTYATAIEHQTGSAKYKSLRGMEVTIPLTLVAELSAHLDDDGWKKTLTNCLPLIRAVGTSCSRGLGRVTVTLEDTNASETI